MFYICKNVIKMCHGNNVTIKKNSIVLKGVFKTILF